MPINSRKKGHALEHKIVNEFLDLGFAEAMTTRLGSKYLDDQKIDIMNVGIFRPQCKAVERLNVHAAYNELPQGDNAVPLLFHKKNRQGTLVTMSAYDFFRLLETMIRHDLWDELL
jgi:hypothetical protein